MMLYLVVPTFQNNYTNVKFFLKWIFGSVLVLPEKKKDWRKGRPEFRGEVKCYFSNLKTDPV